MSNHEPADPPGCATNQGGALVVLCTCPDAATAESLARALVEGNLAACVNIIPGLRSVYGWLGRIETDEEVLLVIKTRAERYEELERTLVEAHPYDLPEVIALAINRGLPDYLAWLENSCGVER